MLYRLRTALARRRFERAAAGILRTPPLDRRPGPLTILSMLCHADVPMHLLAIKSLYPRIGEGGIVVVDDGTLTAADRDLLRRHLGAVEIVPAAAVDTGRCPRGGTWERLVLALDLCRDRYVIQMDADTLAWRAVDEVVAAYRTNVSFALGTRMGRAIVGAADMAAALAGAEDSSVQVRAEKAFARLPGAAGLRYVRGSSGFAGYARGGATRAWLEELSDQLSALVGPAWHDWGSEQVASNLVVANAPQAMVLPYPRYACHDPDVDPEATAFLHFLGTHRFHRGVYRDKARAVIAQLDQPVPPAASAGTVPATAAAVRGGSATR